MNSYLKKFDNHVGSTQYDPEAEVDLAFMNELDLRTKTQTSSDALKVKFGMVKRKSEKSGKIKKDLSSNRNVIYHDGVQSQNKEFSLKQPIILKRRSQKEFEVHQLKPKSTIVLKWLRKEKEIKDRAAANFDRNVSQMFPSIDAERH